VPADDRANEKVLVAWLVQEIADLADAGRVGLYEFPQSLQALQAYDGMSSSAVQSVSAAALARLMATGMYDLGWLTWATDAALEEDGRDLTSIVADPQTWAEIGPSGRYLGIVART
jgi:hypothetical protein